jgi:hypothetical protein
MIQEGTHRNPGSPLSCAPRRARKDLELPRNLSHPSTRGAPPPRAAVAQRAPADEPSAQLPVPDPTRRLLAAPNGHWARKPPSTGSATPVTQLASSLARNATAPAISSGTATRDIGTDD